MKKKIFAIALAASIAVLAIAGTSMAYFTDVEEATNVFTAGNVDIELTYAANDTDIDADNQDNATALEINDANVYPGQVFERDATITNIGSEAAYVGAIVTITNDNGKLKTVIDPAGDDDDNFPVAIRSFFDGLATTGYTVKYAEVDKGYAVYILKTDALAGKTATATDTAVLFKNIVIPTEWDNAEMAAFNGLKVNVKAYATQKAGFADATTALTTAFPATTDWANYNTATVLP